jgi:hypothetical protein
MNCRDTPMSDTKKFRVLLNPCGQRFDWVIMARHSKRSKRKTGTNRATRKVRSTPRSPQLSTLTARQKATRERALELLWELRRGDGPYSKLLRKHRLDARTARKYLGRNLLGGTHGREHALIFHCLTTTDERQEVLFGAYIRAQLEGANYVAKEVGLFPREGHPEELRVLKRFVKNSSFELCTIDQFHRRIFLKYLKAGALIVAYDAPTQIMLPRFFQFWRAGDANHARA